MLNRDELLDKLYRLEKQKAEVTAIKKSNAAAHRDQLKDLNDEIKGVLLDLDEPAPSVTSEPVDFEG